MSEFELRYSVAGPTLRAFHESKAFFRGIRGHVGSGKTVGLEVDLFLKACQQEPNDRGIRESRWALIRNTTPQLKTTTIKTWTEWFPEHIFGKIKWDPPITHHMRFGDVDAEWIFLALDNDKDIRKLLSLELTGAGINEAREIGKGILDAVTQRVGRFPSRRSGVGPTWSGVVADTNPPGPDHWWAIMSGEMQPPDHMTAADLALMVKPDGWEFFTQPPAMIPERDGTGAITGYRMNPDRENAQNIGDDYYERMLAGKTPEWIAVYILNEYGHIFAGRPVYPGFNERLHVAREPIAYMPGHTVYVGMDFGLTPCAIFGQKPRGRWLIQHELVNQDMGAKRFAESFKVFANKHYPPTAEFVITGDPAGDQRAQTDEQRVFDVLRAADIDVKKAPTNDIGVRIDMVAAALSQMIDGNVGYLISPECPVLIAAKRGGYHYNNRDTPEKNEYSHPSDAEQYMMAGAGDARLHLRGDSARTMRPVVAKADFSPFKTTPFARKSAKGGKFRTRTRYW